MAAENRPVAEDGGRQVLQVVGLEKRFSQLALQKVEGTEKTGLAEIPVPQRIRVGGVGAAARFRADDFILPVSAFFQGERLAAQFSGAVDDTGDGAAGQMAGAAGQGKAFACEISSS